MQVLILTAGLGRRMQPLTNARHKTLLEISPGNTILARILDSLTSVGLSDVVVVTGYRRDEVVEFCSKNYPNISFTFVHNDRYDETNNIHSVALAFQEVDFSSGFILIESDLIYDESLMANLLRDPRPNVALLDRYRPGMDGTVVRMDTDDLIIDVIPGSRQGANFDFSDTHKTLNIYKFSADFCRSTFAPLVRFYSQYINDNCYYELILGMLIAMGHASVHGSRVESGSWAEVDDPVDLSNARYLADTAGRRELLDSSWGGYWDLDVLDFAFIRNMHYPTPQVLTELRMQLPDLIANYGSSQRILDQKMAWYLQQDPERIVALNGASQFFPWAAQYYQGRPAFLSKPTFGEWERVFPDAVRYTDDGVVTIPENCPPGSVVVVVNPNNPTGSTAPTAAIIEAIETKPDVTFLVDESFIHFSDQPSLLEHLRDRNLPNAVVLQSLSKALGVPGLRLGFVYSADTDLMASIRGSLPIWNMNGPAEKFLELLLKNRGAIDASFQRTAEDRADLVGRLKLCDIVRRVWPSGADFVLVDLEIVGEESEALADELLAQEGIYVKDVSSKFDDGQGRWRLAVRTPTDHQRLLQGLQSVVDGSTH